LEQNHSFHPLTYFNCRLHLNNNIRFWLVRGDPIILTFQLHNHSGNLPLRSVLCNVQLTPGW
jgi:hypothetical protein